MANCNRGEGDACVLVSESVPNKTVNHTITLVLTGVQLSAWRYISFSPRP